VTSAAQHRGEVVAALDFLITGIQTLIESNATPIQPDLTEGRWHPAARMLLFAHQGNEQRKPHETARSAG
jgi:diacylglycerol kinase family enzyme